MRLKSKFVAGAVAGCAALVVSAAPALAAPVSVTSDAGTTCTLDADASIGGSLLNRKVNYSGTIECSLADPASTPTLGNAGLALDGGLPIGNPLGGLLGDTNSPNQPPSEQPGVESGYGCELEPGADCGATGRATALPGQSYSARFGGEIVPPEGETWTTATDGCELLDGRAACSAVSETVR